MKVRTELALLLALVPSAAAADTVVNGSFESGDYTGWTLTKDASSKTFATAGVVERDQMISYDGWLHDYHDAIDVQQFSSSLPLMGAPTDGGKLAAFLQNGPATQRLYQTIIVPDAPATVSWDLSYQNTWTTFAADQRIRVLVRDADTDAVLATLFETVPGDPMDRAMTHFSADVSAFAGQRVRLDVTLDVREHFLDTELDNIRVDGAAVPDPPALPVALDPAPVTPRSPDEPAAEVAPSVGCAAASPGGAGALVVALVALRGLRRRRRS